MKLITLVFPFIATILLVWIVMILLKRMKK
ncbi:hypothetical protein J2Z18_005140 [Paenibacillus lactis]|uniref:Uncharacterized protein n=1 Tax=Paenibacillus lactis TaxID=228574 RepID=A0ABS4FIK2_9BACL|nr:hypothetical protein [Paenibacillus lactis]